MSPAHDLADAQARLHGALEDHSAHVRHGIEHLEQLRVEREAEIERTKPTPPAAGG